MKPSNRRIIVNTLGKLSNPNVETRAVAPRASADSFEHPMSARVLSEAKESGLTAAILTLVGMMIGTKEPFEDAIRTVARYDAILREYPDDLIKVLKASDIVRAKEENKIGVIYGFQNGLMMGNDATRVDIFADLGVRAIQLTYNGLNQLGGGSSCFDDPGVTPLGREVIARLNERRVMLDLSHSGERTCIEAAKASKAPVSINHTGCRALADITRNKSDVELRLVGDKGGYVGIYFMAFLDNEGIAHSEDLLAHIDHAVNVCGEDCVGIGTDGPVTQVDDVKAHEIWVNEENARRRAAGVASPGERDNTYCFLPDLRGPEQFRQLADLLAKNGCTERRIDKILGLNFLRFAKDVWEE